MKPIFTVLLLVAALPVTVWAEEASDTPSENPAIRLESTFIGDKEQPAVSYFVPWQGTRTPDRLQWSMEDKHDGTLEAVDRDVLNRSVTIYQEMQLEGAQ